MKVSKRIIIPAIGFTMAGSLYGATKVRAASNPNRRSLVQELSTTFHLDPSKVQTVVAQHKSEVAQSREANYEQRLDQAVTDGKLTASQKSLVLTEHDKLQSELQSDLANDPTGHSRALGQLRQAASAWAKQNGIDVSWLLPGHGLRHQVQPNS